MDSFSSSMFNNRLQSWTAPPPLLNTMMPATCLSLRRHHVPFLKTSSVRIEEKLQKPTNGTKAATTSTAATTPQQPSKQNSPCQEEFIDADAPVNSQKKRIITSTDTRRKNAAIDSSSAAVALKAKTKTVVPANPSIATTLCNVFDDVINKFIDPPLRTGVDPKYVLADNFAPIDELPPTECTEIEGELPPCLDGAYIRNGPNPQYLPRGPYHLFDGDGMLHCLRILRGRATFCSRYVKTYRYNLEHDAGAPILPYSFSGFFNLAGAATRGAVVATRFLTGQFNPMGGAGLANTSLVFFGNRLFALGESDLPYAVHLTPEGDIETTGRCDFEGKLLMGMTAHPKKDPETGEVFAFRYGPVPPFLTLFRFDAEGSKQPDVPIFSIVQPTFLHDFAITNKYALIPDIQVVIKPLDLMMGFGSPVGSDTDKVPRIGVIPRYASTESEIKWIKVPGFNNIHAINAWDDGDDTIELVAPNILSIEHALEQMELVHCTVEKVRIELKTGKVTRRTLSSRNLDFGVINPRYTGKKNRYAYLALGDPMPKITGVVKVDYGGEGGEEVIRRYGPGCYGGEPFFVARDPDNPEADEDDGYVVSYVHDEISGESRFLVMDAQSPTLQVVASVKLPRRVPYGFHGLFVSERDLQKQNQLYNRSHPNQI